MNVLFTRCVRRFRTDDGAPVVLEKTFAFTTAPTMGSKLTFAGEDLLLTVVGVTLRSTTTAAGVQPAGLEVELEYENLDAADVARERGWEPIA